MQNFWQNFKTPFFCSAPMAGITDIAFRQMLLTFGRSDVMWTEMVSVESIEREIVKEYKIDLKFYIKEQPLVAQIFGSKPKQFIKATKLIKKLGFSGIDINMGCPDKNIIKQGAGSALIKNPKLATQIIKTVQANSGHLPVLVKTRLGFLKFDLDWHRALLKTQPAALTIHGRTKQQMYAGQADWDKITEVVRLRDKISPQTVIIGNGDVKSLEQGRKQARQSGVDGVMIGRAMLSEPWVFGEKAGSKNRKERVGLLIEHATLYNDFFGTAKHFDNFKKFIKTYISDFTGSKELRVKLMSASSVDELINIAQKYG